MESVIAGTRPKMDRLCEKIRSTTRSISWRGHQPQRAAQLVYWTVALEQGTSSISFGKDMAWDPF